MSKTWDTKKKILKLLSKENLNLTEISHMLGLAPSTVSKHIEELKRVGAITQVENPFIKKWKYYTATPNFNTDGVIRGNFMSLNTRVVKMEIAAGVIAVGLIALYWFYASQQPHILSFQLTDPPQVPVGTQALILNYSSLRAHYIGSGNASGWISANSKGSVNLMSLVNATEMIGSAAIPASATINQINLTVSSVSIEINGTEENVTLPNRHLLVNVNGTAPVDSGSVILIDLSPTIVSIFTQNATVFVMVSSVRAVLLGPQAVEAEGTTSKLSSNEQKALQATPVINISSASITTSGQNSTLFVTVTNYGSANVSINRILLYGNLSVLALLNSNSTNLAANDYRTYHSNIAAPPNLSGSASTVTQTISTSGSTAVASSSASSGSSTNIASDVGQVQGSEFNASATTNATAKSKAPLNKTINRAKTELSIIDGIQVETNASANAGASTNSSITTSSIVHVGVSIRHLQMLDFEIGSSGRLSLANEEQSLSSTGYVIQAHSSTTFTFSGRLLEANGRIVVSPVSNSTYKIVVIGRDSSISTTVMAQ